VGALDQSDRQAEFAAQGGFASSHLAIVRFVVVTGEMK
jgi:hypothetical protein